MVCIQGEFDATDFDKAWVPDTAFEDPTVPQRMRGPDGKLPLRVLSLKEYIAAREQQTGWRLARVDPQPCTLFGKVVVLNVTLTWRVA